MIFFDLNWGLKMTSAFLHLQRLVATLLLAAKVIMKA